MAMFANHAVWITGAGSGLGAEMAREFARHGADVILSGRRVDRLESVAEEIRALGRRAAVVPCDVTNEDDVEASAKRAQSAFGRLDVVVANAGFGVSDYFEKLSAADWRRQFDTNVIGLVMTAKHSLPFLRSTQGRVVLIGSVMSYVAMKKSGPYVASKFAVRGIGDTLQLELAGTGISCTTIYPGLVDSEIFQVDNKGQHHTDWSDRRPHQIMWDTPRAARVMVKAIHARKRDYVFTGHGRLGVFLARFFPGLLRSAMMAAGKKMERPDKG
jgi:short-subunit dehydrogenase